MNVSPFIASLIERGALFVVNHSGGKDSQLMLIELAKVIPLRQLLVVHATLGEFEWHGAKEHAKAQADALGVPFLVAHAYWKDGSSKDFLGMVDRRKADRPSAPSFPSKNNRYCTSDLKRDPILREIRRYVAKSGHKLIVNCEGIRAAESDDRAKRNPFTVHEGDKLNAAGRSAWTWLPIFEVPTEAVIPAIYAHGQEPHPAYALGNERLSCVFCFLGSPNDLANGARMRPELFARYVEAEKRTGSTLHMSGKPLAELVREGEAKRTRLIEARQPKTWAGVPILAA